MICLNLSCCPSLKFKRRNIREAGRKKELIPLFRSVHYTQVCRCLSTVNEFLTMAIILKVILSKKYTSPQSSPARRGSSSSPCRRRD